MTFNEAVQAMLDGKKVKRVNTTGVCYGYIVLDADGDTVDSNGNQVILSKRDFVADWGIASVPAAGTLLTRYGKSYRLIKALKRLKALPRKTSCMTFGVIILILVRYTKEA